MIRFLYGGRRSGKTTVLIKLAERDNAYILVSDHNRAQNVADMARKMGCHILFPITFHEFWGTKNRGYVKKLLIDDADHLLEHMAIMQGWTLEGATISKHDDYFFEIPEKRREGETE